MQHFTPFVFLFLLAHSSLPAEELPTLPFLALTVRSDEIWEAEPLYPDSAFLFLGKNRHYDATWLRVRITQSFRSRLFQAGDTVWVNAGTAYSWPHGNREYRSSRCSGSSTLRRLLLFCQGMTAEQYEEAYSRKAPHGACAGISLSGIRLLDQQQNIFHPFQNENPGSYQFYCDTSARWPELLAQAQHDIRRVDTLFALRAIENPWVQNDLLFAWIARHETELTDEYNLDNWYWYRDLPFNWILCNGIHQQSWEVVLRHRRMFPDEILARSEWSELGELPQPFSDAAGLKFLLEKGQDITLEPALRTAALHFFADACWDNTLPNPERVALFGEIRKLYPSLDQYSRGFAINAAALLAFDFERNKRVADAMPFFQELRQLEPPGEQRNTLSEIIVRNSTADEWQAVSGNEGRVLVTLYHFYYDSLKQTLRFFFNQQSGVEGLYEQPILEFYQLNKKGKSVNHREIPLPVTSPNVDWATGSLRSHGAASVEVSVRDLPKGAWHFRARGTGGAGRQYRWVSEPAVFTF